VTVDDLFRIASQLKDPKLDGAMAGILAEAEQTVAAHLRGTVDVEQLSAFDGPARDALDLLTSYKARELAFWQLDGGESERVQAWRDRYNGMLSGIRSGEIRLADNQRSGIRGKVVFL
jgi:hypothetical protein